MLWPAAFAFGLLQACDEDSCRSDGDCKGARVCDAGACVDPEDVEGGEEGAAESPEGEAGEAGEEGEAGEAGEAGEEGEEGGDVPPASCAETSTYCEGNVLYDCDTNAVQIDCDSCQYVGPGSGSEYDTSCKAQMSDCTTCGGEMPWTGPGCYFGGGPAICGG